GITVTLIDGRTELLGHVDREIVDILLRQMRHRLRIHLHLGNEVTAFRPAQATVMLQLSQGREIQVEKVLYAVGRQSNTAELDLAKAGLQTGIRGAWWSTSSIRPPCHTSMRRAMSLAFPRWRRPRWNRRAWRWSTRSTCSTRPNSPPSCPMASTPFRRWRWWARRRKTASRRGAPTKLGGR